MPNLGTLSPKLSQMLHLYERPSKPHISTSQNSNGWVGNIDAVQVVSTPDVGKKAKAKEKMDLILKVVGTVLFFIPFISG